MAPLQREAGRPGGAALSGPGRRQLGRKSPRVRADVASLGFGSLHCAKALQASFLVASAPGDQATYVCQTDQGLLVRALPSPPQFLGRSEGASLHELRQQDDLLHRRSWAGNR